ncbi:MAG TPA: hypothetical protein VEH83_10790 [Gemmatimonadales bacterium]|nr:hypothetical protein [Gemmatimonadales bacterium]
MTAPELTRYVAGLARAVALLQRSPDPGEPQKDALRALVDLAAGRSATFRFYGGELTLDGVAVPTADPRLAAFAERLAAQSVAEIVIAKGAGPDELLALALGLAAEPGFGRIKERLRDANSARVMVVLQQFDQQSARTVSAAFEKMRYDQSVLSEWNKYLEQGTRAEAERVADAQGDGTGPTIPVGGAPGDEASPFDVGNLEIIEPEQNDAAPAREGELEMFPPPQPAVRLPRPSVIEEAVSPESWLGAFERSVKKKFPDHFGDVDWGYRFDKATGTVTAGDLQGRSSLSISLPSGYLEQSAWLLAGKLLAELRKRAEEEGAVRRKR